MYGIVKQNKGFVWVYSEKGHGSTFKVYLPRSSNEITETDPGDISVKMLEGYETVLIVEDDEYLRKVVKIALDQFGYKTLEACDGQAAVSLCESYGGQIDLMITDVVMPRMSGRETADRVKVLFPDIRVVFVSGYTDNAIVHHGVLDSGIHFLEKPFSPEKLLRKVRFVLDGEQ